MQTRIPLSLARRVVAGSIAAFCLCLICGPRPGLAAYQAPGLLATYSDASHSVHLVVPVPNFYLGPDESLHPSLAPAFQAEWAGSISILKAGGYRFGGGARVYISGREAGGEAVPLSAGLHPIRITYQRRPGASALRLSWVSEHFPSEAIPSSAFSHDPVGESKPDQRIAKGRRLAAGLGCVNCHSADSPSLKSRPGPNLSGAGSRLRAPWIYTWLDNPSAFRSDALMPSSRDERERRDVTAYLVSLSAREAIPEVKKPSAQDERAGMTKLGSLGCIACHRKDVLSLAGLGSKTTLAALAFYLQNPGRIDASGTMPSMLLSSQEAIEFASYLVLSRDEAFEQDFSGGDAARGDAARGDEARGKALVQSRGCLACHALSDPEPLANQQSAPPLASLSAERGCLADDRPDHVPLYRLESGERNALRAFVRSYRENPDVSAAPVHDFYRDVEQLRCLNCHRMNQVAPRGLIAESAPALTDLGAKMRPGWLRGVVSGDLRIREWLTLRMPAYSRGRGGAIVAGFAQAAGVAPGEGDDNVRTTAAEQASTAQASAAQITGVAMLGTNAAQGGLSCITCHGVGEQEALGEDGPPLTRVAERLRYDWYRRWMLNPARILSGTSMPAYFASLEPAEASAKIDALWAAFSMGETMPLPEGFAFSRAGPEEESRPVPVDEAIVIRWDMPEATPSAIAVGLPGGVSYCFDAGRSQLLYAWLGGFVDVTATLHEKRDRETKLTRTVDIAGEIYYRAKEFPIRIGDRKRLPQRKFRGYRLIDSYPEFHYEVDGASVYERVSAAPGRDGIVREFRISEVRQPMWFLPSVGNDVAGNGVAVTSSLAAEQPGVLRIPEGSDVRFTVTLVKRK